MRIYANVLICLFRCLWVYDGLERLFLFLLCQRNVRFCNGHISFIAYSLNFDKTAMIIRTIIAIAFLYANHKGQFHWSNYFPIRMLVGTAYPGYPFT